jgi:hypothetical protein
MNFKRIFAVMAIGGMLAVTGCSSNTPARNQGNRNGQRVADAANRRADSYAGIDHTEGTGRTTRGLFGRNTDNGSRITRTENRSTTLGRPHYRAGNTFRRGNTRTTAQALEHNSNYGMTRTDRGVSGTGMNHTDRGISGSGMNRATRRATNRLDGVALANNETTPVFFNKSKTAAPEQSAPEQAPAPKAAPAQ